MEGRSGSFPQPSFLVKREEDGLSGTKGNTVVGRSRAAGMG